MNILSKIRGIKADVYINAPYSRAACIHHKADLGSTMCMKVSVLRNACILYSEMEPSNQPSGFL